MHWKPNRIINLYNLINRINVISPVHLPVAHLQIPGHWVLGPHALEAQTTWHSVPEMHVVRLRGANVYSMIVMRL